jgi:hypothetical protein
MAEELMEMINIFDTQEKSGLSITEAGWLLQKRRSEILAMIQQGDLLPAAVAGEIDPESVRPLLAEELHHQVLDIVISGILTAPPLEWEDAQPGPLPVDLADLVEGLAFWPFALMLESLGR